MPMMKYKYNSLLRHPGYNGDFFDDVLGFDDSGGIVGSAGNIADDVLGLDPNGGGIYDIPVIGDIAEELVVGPVGAVVSMVVPPLAVVRAAQALSVAHDTGKGSLAAVAQAAMAAYGVATAPTVPVDIGAGITVPVNANVVAATEMALAEGYTAEQVAKTLVGFGDKATTQAVLQQAGYPAAQSSWAAMTAETAAATDSAAIANMSSEQISNLQTAVNSGDAAATTQQLSSAGIASPSFTAADAAQSVQAMQQAGLGSDFIAEQVSNWQSAGITTEALTSELTSLGISPATVGLSQAQMLTDQYKGFTSDAVLNHMAGSSIDPVLAEEIMGNLGYDPFMVSDYMDANPTSFGNTYADPSFLDKLKSGLKTAKTLQGLLGSSGGGTGGTGSPNVNKNYSQLMSQLDPYWDYRKNTEIPLMGAAAGAAGQLSGLYQQSFTNPLGVYNTPEMQATNAAFMDEMQRRDAASGRLSQYGARAVQAQNKFLTNTLPTYRTNLQQGLGTLYQAARPQASDSQATASAMGQASLLSAANAANQQGTIAGSVGNLQNSWNQMTGSNNVFDQISGAVNTASNVADLYTKGSQAWDTLSNLF
jgi:hypothetical protein